MLVYNAGWISWPSSAWKWSARRNNPGNAPLLVTLPLGTSPMSGRMGITPRKSLPPPPLASTPQVYANILPWVLSMWCQRDDSGIVTPQTLQLTIVYFPSLNLYPSPVDRRLCAAYYCYTQTNRRINTNAFVLPGFVYSPTISNIHTSTVSAFCTHRVFWP